MFGLLRLLLAAMVALSHASVSLGPYNLGVAAVVVFFLISGYVTGAILGVKGQRGAPFYAERLVRLMPTYACAAALALAAWGWGLTGSAFLSRAPTAGDWAANLAVIPLNYFMFTGQDQFTLLPPAWSLGLEMQFYLLAPFLLRPRSRALLCVMGASFGLYAVAGAGAIDADTWGYRLLPGVLFIFLAGACLRRGLWWGALGAWVGCLALLATIAAGVIQARPFNVETAAGVAVGLPALFVLRSRPRPAWDDWCANLAYPFFLLHFPVYWLLEPWVGPAASLSRHGLSLAACLGLTLALSWATYVGAEAPLNAWRRRIRRRGQVFSAVGGCGSARDGVAS